MGLVLITTPKRTVQGIESNVTAGLSQVPYKFQRRDFTLSGSADAAGQTVLNVDSIHGDITGALTIGDILFVSGANYTIGKCTVISFLWSDPITEILVDSVWVQDVGIGYFNFLSKRQDYRVLLNAVDPSTGANILPLPLSYVPDTKGELFVNTANMFSTVVIAGNAVNFQLWYAEYYEGQMQNNDTDDPVFAVAARRQLLDEGGANMWRYLPNFAGVGLGVGKQLTAFLNPFVYIGWRSWLSTIYDEDINNRLGGITVGFRIRSTDRNGGLLDEQSFLQLPQNLPRIHIENIPDELKTVENAFYLSSYLNSTSGAVSQNLVMEIKKPCVNPVMIEWIGRNGASEQYMFSHNQEISTEAKEGLIFEHPIDNTLDNVSSNIGRITRGSSQYITLLAENIPQQHIAVLKYLKESPRVLLWLDTQGDKNTRVAVSGVYSTAQSTRRIFGDFTITLRLSRNFDFTKSAD